MAKSKKSQKSLSDTAAIPHTQTWRDVKSALLLVSLLINAFFLVGWMILRFTNYYDTVLISTLLGR